LLIADVLFQDRKISLSKVCMLRYLKPAKVSFHSYTYNAKM